MRNATQSVLFRRAEYIELIGDLLCGTQTVEIGDVEKETSNSF